MIRLVIAVIAGLLLLPDVARGVDFTPTTTADGFDGDCAQPPATGDCTLREAVAEVGSGDRVVLEAETYELTDGQLILNFDTIVGAGARATTIDANDTSRIALVPDGTSELTDLTVRGGLAAGAAPADKEGGAFYVATDGELRLLRVALIDNHAQGAGGAIANVGDLSVTETTVSGNSSGNALAPSISGAGGGIFIGTGSQAISLLNSTISGNTAVAAEGISHGGGLYASDNYSAQHLTIANNTAVEGAGLYHGDASGELHEVLIAENSGPECGGSPGLLDEDHNLSEDDTCGFTALGDLQNVDAKLAPLAERGGPTDTHALLNGSPALGASREDTCPLTDQRGTIRPQPGPCAIGAFEGSIGADYTVNTNSDHTAGACDAADCTLREAVEAAGAGDRVIVPPNNYVLAQGSLSLLNDFILGSNARSTIITGAAEERVLEATVGDNRVTGVTITGGEAVEDVGGGVLVVGNTTSLTLTSVTVSGNFARNGGGVGNVGATLDIVRSTITDNDAGETENGATGGGIYAQASGLPGVTRISNSTISGNRASNGESVGEGGGISVINTSLTARNVTLAGNRAFHGTQSGDGPGAIVTDGSGTVTLSNSIIAGNGPFACNGQGISTTDRNIVNDSLCGSPLTNPLLGALAANGATTDTHAIGTTSPAVDKGAGCEPTDQRGLPRKRACDIGAYEFQGNLPPSGGQNPPPPPPDDGELPDPVPHKNVNALPKSGTVMIKLPGSDKFVELEEGQQIPLGTIVDTRKGRVTIVAAAGNGQKADFYAGLFKLSQTKGNKPITVLTLVEKLTGCKAKGKATAAAKKKKKRRLWGNGKGRFRTKPKHQAATIVGTKWLVEDRCNLSLTRVVRGKVRVRDLVKKKTVIVKAGQKYVTKAP